MKTINTLACSLRQRSPFSITSIMMVGARVRDGGGELAGLIDMDVVSPVPPFRPCKLRTARLYGTSSANGCVDLSTPTLGAADHAAMESLISSTSRVEDVQALSMCFTSSVPVSAHLLVLLAAFTESSWLIAGE